jgi:hypothetical protein
VSGVTCALHPDVPLDEDGVCLKCDLESEIGDDELAEMPPSPLRDLLDAQPPFSVQRESIEYQRDARFATPRPRHGAIVVILTIWCWCQRLRKTRRIYVGQRIDVWIPAHRSKIGTFKQGLGASRVFSLGIVFVRWWYEPKARRPSLIADVRNRVAP